MEDNLIYSSSAEKCWWVFIEDAANNVLAGVEKL